MLKLLIKLISWLGGLCFKEGFLYNSPVLFLSRDVAHHRLSALYFSRIYSFDASLGRASCTLRRSASLTQRMKLPHGNKCLCACSHPPPWSPTWALPQPMPPSPGGQRRLPGAAAPQSPVPTRACRCEAACGATRDMVHKTRHWDLSSTTTLNPVGKGAPLLAVAWTPAC